MKKLVFFKLYYEVVIVYTILIKLQFITDWSSQGNVTLFNNRS